jgi:uncharacterized protein YcbK (DUF882 family)
LRVGVSILVALACTASVAFAGPPKAPKRTAMSPAKYAQAVRTWHTAAPGKSASHDDSGRAMLTLVALNTGERLELAASSDEGAFSSRDLDRAAHVLREPSSASEHPLEPRLVDLLYRIQRKFDAQEIRVVSAFRPGRGTLQKGPVRSAGSNHACGRASDIVVPGARDEDVAKFARELGFVGVGLYPTSGFVHVDVRNHSYFWVDRSGPGRRNRERGIFADLARKSDGRANARGEHPTPPFAIGVEVDSFLDSERSDSTAEAPDEDDDE